MVSIGPKIQITGESEYRQSLNRIISETKALNSEMDLMVAKFSKSDSAIDKNKQKQEMLTRQIEQAKKQYDKFNEGLDKAKSVYDANQKALEKLNKEKERAQYVLQKLTSEYGENNKYVEATKVHIKDLDAQIADTNKEIERSGKVMADWQTKTNQAGLELQNLKNELRDLPSTIKLVGESMEKWGGAIESVGSSLTAYLTTPLIAAGGAFIKWSSDFVDGMAKIYTIAEESQKPMAEMRQELIELSNQSGYSLEDLAEAEYQAVSASVSTEKAVEFLTDATRLARGGFTSTTKAVDLLTTVINAYGYQAEDAAYISDVLLRTQNDGKTIIDELAQSMGTVIPTAANYNVSLEQLAAAYATMTKQGVNTSRATTFLNAMFTELEKSSSTISKTLDTATGKSFAQLMGEGYSLADVLNILYTAVEGDNEQFQRLFGNIRSGKAASALLTDDFGILNYEVSRMNNALGQTDHAMEVLETPSLKAKRAIQQLKNTGMEMGTVLMNRLMPAFLKGTEAIKDFTEYVAKFNDRSWKMVTNFGAVAVAAGPVISVIGKLTKAVGMFMAGTAPLTTTLSLITGIALAFGALITKAEVAAEQHRQELSDAYNLTGKYEDLIESSKSLTESYEETNKAIAEKKEATLAELGFAETLIERYNELVDSEGNVKEGYEGIASAIITRLAEALGMQYEDVQALIEQNGLFGESIRQNIEDMKARAEAAAQEKYLTEAYEAQYEAKYKLNELESAAEEQREKVRQAENELRYAEEQRNKAIENGIDVTEQQAQALVDAQTKYDAAKQGLSELEGQIKETTAVYEESSNTVGQVLDDLVPKTDSALQGMADTIRIKGQELSTNSELVGKMAAQGLLVDLDDTGYQFVNGFASAIDRYSYLAKRSAAQLAYEAKTSLNGSLSIESPSKVTAETGKYFTEGFVIGIQDTLREARQSAAMLAESAMSGLQMSSYTPYPTQNNYNRVSAPINITMNVDGQTGDYYEVARVVSERINEELTRKLGYV